MTSIIQTSVSDTMPKGYPGFTAGVAKETTATNSEASLNIPMGVVVVQNGSYLTDRQAAKSPTASGDVVLGISAWNPYSTDELDTTTEGIKPGRPFRVVQNGRVLVKPETAVVRGARAFFRITANGPLTQLGAIRADADTANAVELKGSYFEESGAANSLVWLRIDDAANRAVQS